MILNQMHTNNLFNLNHSNFIFSILKSGVFWFTDIIALLLKQQPIQYCCITLNAYNSGKVYFNPNNIYFTNNNKSIFFILKHVCIFNILYKIQLCDPWILFPKRRIELKPADKPAKWINNYSKSWNAIFVYTVSNTSH